MTVQKMLESRHLIIRIKAAWQDAVPPDRQNISRPTNDDEGVAAYFAGKSWHGHSATRLRALDFAPNVFTEQAFAYFLPAYLIADIEDPVASDTNVERVLYWLGQGPRVIGLLSPEQKAVLRDYVKFVCARDGDGYDAFAQTVVHLLDQP